LQAKFGIEVAKDLITVMGRELDVPSVTYRDQRSVDPRDGGWLMKGVKVASPGSFIADWSYLHSGIGETGRMIRRSVEDFAAFLATRIGVNMNQRPTQPDGEFTRFDGSDLKRALDNLKGLRPRLQLVLVVLPEKSTELYSIIKKLADTEYGFHTVCVTQPKFLKQQGQLGYFSNVALKVNLKFGGVNHLLKDQSGIMSRGKTMFVGYDVTHPTNLPPGVRRENSPSLVGLVASVDKHLAQWPSVSWNNPERVEMLGDELVINFQSRLKLWQSRNGGRLPEDIVIFRDGVSEGQFSQVLAKELPFIRKACDLTYTAISARSPRITLIVSVKRHQTRFYPTDPAHMHQRSKSPKEGTVVDRGVTNVRYWDFFLQAHASLQGKHALLLILSW
jgi:hypothetical protein